MITNYHVIKGCDINKLTFKGSQTEVKVLAVDKVNDIAILKSNTKPDVIFPVSNEDVSLLEDVIVAGYPLGKKVSSAIWTGDRDSLNKLSTHYASTITEVSDKLEEGNKIRNENGYYFGSAFYYEKELYWGVDRLNHLEDRQIGRAHV